MTIDDQIRDEKLQYDINKETAKISALSWSKINKYEYLIGEETLPSNQKQIIEQAKFTYSLLGKAFEKQIKTIEDQGEKQIKAIQNQGQVKTIKKFTYADEGSPLISKQKEIFNKLLDERLDKITKLDEKVNLDDLIYRCKGKTQDGEFNKYDSALNLNYKMKNGERKLSEAKSNPKKFKSSLGKIKLRKQQKKIKTARKKRAIQYWDALQSKKRGY